MPDRSRPWPSIPYGAGLVLLGAALLPGCGPEDDPVVVTPPQPKAHGGTTGSGGPLEALAELSPEDRLLAVRKALFGDGHGLDRLDLEVFCGSDECRVLLGPEGAMRIHEANGTNLLRAEGRDTAWSGLGRSVGAAEATETERLDAWQFLIDAILLRALHADGELSAPDLHTLQGKDATGHQVTLSLGDDARPARLASGEHHLSFESYVNTGTGSFPERVVHSTLGDCTVRVVGHAMAFDSTTFQPPTEADLRELRDEQERASTAGQVNEVERGAASLFLIPDPGTWSERFTALSDMGRRLVAAGNVRPVEDAALVERDGETWLQVAFTGTFDAEKLEQSDGELLIERMAERVLEIEVPPGLWSERIAQAERKLREKLDAAERREAGIELLFNHVTRTGQADDPNSRRTMIVHLRAALR